MLPQRMRVHGHFGSEAEAAFSADEIFRVGVNEVMGVELPSHLEILKKARNSIIIAGDICRCKILP